MQQQGEMPDPPAAAAAGDVVGARRHGLEQISDNGEYTCRCGAIFLDARGQRNHMRRTLKVDRKAAKEAAAFREARQGAVAIEPADTQAGRPCPVCGAPLSFSPELNRRYCSNDDCPMARRNRRPVEREE